MEAIKALLTMNNNVKQHDMLNLMTKKILEVISRCSDFCSIVAFPNYRIIERLMRNNFPHNSSNIERVS